MEKTYWVYILASGLGGTLYIGVTNDLVRRIYEHRMGFADGFTKKYEVHRPVYFEPYGDVEEAIRREKRLKRWNRAWKIRLIEGSAVVPAQGANRKRRFFLEAPATTGSSAFADDDNREALPCRRSARWSRLDGKIKKPPGGSRHDRAIARRRGRPGRRCGAVRRDRAVARR
jgi:putative endonuclease